MSTAREKVLDMLTEINEKGAPSHIVINSFLSSSPDMERRDRAFCKKLCQGVVERRITLDHMIGVLSSVRVDKLKPVIRNLLRMGIYQMAYMDVPDSAACNETVKIARKRGFGNLSGFVNGILRNFARRREELLSFSDISDERERFSVEYSCPRWLADEWTGRFGARTVREIMEYFLTDHPTRVRCNSSRIAPEELKKRLRAAGITVEDGSFSKRAFRISGYDSLSRIEEFNEGLFTVQDESSVLAGELADFGPDDMVLDLCAAPGGKSLNAADIMRSAGGHGRVTACDVSEQKVRLIRENIDRCGFDNITTLVSDATVFVPAFEHAFDKVIADVPCSGLGIIGQKPDIRYNMTPEKIGELVILQRQILDNAARYVRPGGRLIFSTCTLDVRENEDNTDRLIREYGLKPVALELSGVSEKGISLIPGHDGTDGFYISVLEV